MDSNTLILLICSINNSNKQAHVCNTHQPEQCAERTSVCFFSFFPVGGQRLLKGFYIRCPKLSFCPMEKFELLSFRQMLPILIFIRFYSCLFSFFFFFSETVSVQKLNLKSFFCLSQICETYNIFFSSFVEVFVSFLSEQYCHLGYYGISHNQCK